MTPSTLDTILAAVDLSTITSKVGTVGVTVVGIALAFAGIGLAVKLVRRAKA